MAAPQTVDNENIISSETNSPQKKALEGRWLTTTTITNIQEGEFEGMWDSEIYLLAPGESKAFPAPLADHLSATMASQILTRDGKIPSDNIPEYNDLINKILGKEIVDYSAKTYEELVAMAEEKKISTTKANSKPKTKAELTKDIQNAK